MFCKYCASLDLDAAPTFGDTEDGAPHQESFADLVASGDNGCELCKWITDYARNDDPEMFQEYLHSSERLTYYYYSLDSYLLWSTRRHNVAVLNICAAKGQPSISASDIS